MNRISPEWPPERGVDFEAPPEREGSTTVVAHPNIAFIKYWGNKEENLPPSDTISMNLSELSTITSVGWSSALQEDVVILDGQLLGGKKLQRTIAFLDEVRKRYGIRDRAYVFSRNNFPMGSGIASSASGFSALALAASKAARLDLSERELSTLARLGSGSASRSIPDGFVLWHTAERHEDCYAESIYRPDWWDLRDIVVILSTGEKQISSAEGHRLAHTSPHFETRVNRHLPERIERVLKALATKDIELLGETIEEEALELHLVAQTSTPSLVYATSETWELTRQIREWRKKEGIAAFFTLDAGPNVHIITQGVDGHRVVERLLESGYSSEAIIMNRPGKGAEVIG